MTDRKRCSDVLRCCASVPIVSPSVRHTLSYIAAAKPAIRGASARDGVVEAGGVFAAFGTVQSASNVRLIRANAAVSAVRAIA